MQWNEKLLTMNNSPKWEAGHGQLSAAFLKDILLSAAWQAAIPELRKPWDLRLTTHKNSSGRKIEQRHLSIYQKKIKALRNTEMWTGELSELGAVSLLSSNHSRTISRGFSWSQDLWSSLPQVNPCSRDGRAAHPMSLQLCGWRSTERMLLSEQNQSSLSHHFHLSAISWWEWEAAFIWSLFCFICLRNGHQIKQKHRRASRLQNPRRQGLLLCRCYKQAQNSWTEGNCRLYAAARIINF